MFFFSELNSNDPIQGTHLITRREVDIELTNRKIILTETTPTNDNNQVCSNEFMSHRKYNKFCYFFLRQKVFFLRVHINFLSLRYGIVLKINLKF